MHRQLNELSSASSFFFYFLFFSFFFSFLSLRVCVCECSFGMFSLELVLGNKVVIDVTLLIGQ